MDNQSVLRAWLSVFTMTLGVMLLISVEFMPNVLLSPMAATLQEPEGAVGQSIAISGIFAIITSLLFTTIIGNANRKWVLIGTILALLISVIVMARAESLRDIVISRVFIGISVGGFWSLAAAVVMRLVPSEHIAKAMTIMYMGQAIAATFSAPLGNLLAQFMGWRGVFWAIAPIALSVIILQWLTLPSMPAAQKQSLSSFLTLFSRPDFRKGMLATFGTWSTGFIMFLYLRPFLEQVTQARDDQITLIYLIIGIGGFLGTWVTGRYVAQYLRRLFIVPPLIMGSISTALLIFGESYAVTSVLLFIWGAMNTAISVIWLYWISQNLSDEAEAAGGVFVATVQAAIMASGLIGGGILDAFGIQATFTLSAMLALITTLIIGSGRKIMKPSS